MSKIILKTKAKVWKAVTTTMLTVSDEMPLTISPNALKSVVMHPSHVSLVKLVCKKEIFQSLQIEKETEIIVFTKVINDLVKRFDDDEFLTFSIDTETKQILINPESSEKVFDLKTLDTSVTPQAEIPNIDYNTKAIISISQLKEMIEDCKVVNAASAWLTTKNGKLHFEGKDDIGKATGVLLDDFEEPLENTSYSFEYLSPFLTSIEKFSNKEISMQLATRKPLFLQAELEGIGLIQYYLAPKSQE